MTATTATFTNATVSNTITTNTLQSTTARATNLTVTSTATISTISATNTTTQNLTVNGTATAGTMNATNSTIQNTVVPVKITASNAQVNGNTTTGSLTVSSQSAVVGGRNVVRAVNGATADGNGNLTLALPPQGVQDIRLGSEISTPRSSLGRESFVYRAAGGCMVTGFNIWSASHKQDEFVDIYSRPIQKYINGGWYTIGQL